MARVDVIGYDCVDSIYVQDEFMESTAGIFFQKKIVFEIICTCEGFQFTFKHKTLGAEIIGSYMNKSAIPLDIDFHKIPQFLYERGLLSILSYMKITCRQYHNQYAVYAE